MKSYLFHICLALLIPNLLGAQPKYFSKIYDNGVFQSFRSVKSINDKFIFLGNFTTSQIPWSIMLFNMDNNCDSIWKKEIVLPEGEIVSGDFVITASGYTMVGNKTLLWEDNYTTAYQAHLTTTDTEGNLANIIPLSSLPSTALGITSTEDGGYLIIGSIIPNYPNVLPYDIQMYAVKLNHQFAIEWERIYNDMGFSYDNYLTDIMPAPDGSGYYLLGTVKWGANADIILLHIDHYGNPLNHHLFNINGMDQSLRFIPTPDGSLLISGSVQGELNVSKGVVLKVNEQGEIKWANQLFSATDVVGYIGPLLIAPDGNYVGAGAQRIVGSPKKNDVYIVKLAAETGAILWQRHYGGNKYEYCYDMIATTDGGYLMVGRQDTTLGALAYLIKTNCMGLLSEPQADFTFSTNANNLSATFYNQSQYVYPDSIDGGHYIWHFGDGTPPLQTQSSAPITHNYPEEGAYYTALYAIVCQDTSIFEAVVKPQSGWGTAVGIPQTPPFFEGGQGGQQVVVYPNPAQNTLHFTLQNSLTPPAGWSVSLFTPAGQRVLHSVVSPVGTPATAGVGTPVTASIQVGHLPVGMYFYTIEWGGVVLARGKVAVVR